MGDEAGAEEAPRRSTVRSMYWSTSTKVPGGSSSLSEPTALTETRSVTPSRFRTSMLAR